MTKNKTIVSVVGARPNFVKLAAIQRNLPDDFNHCIIHTGQHYDFEMSEIFFNDFMLPMPKYNLEVGMGSRAYQISEIIRKIEPVLIAENPKLVLVYGDTNSTFAGAFAASSMGLKLAHVEAGLRSFDRRMPEETNRILTDNLSDILFAPTRNSIINLKKENNLCKIVESGDLSVEIVNQTKSIISKAKKLSTLDVTSKSYILFTMHRAENTASKSNLVSIVKAFEILKDVDIVFPIHPRTRKVLKDYNLYERLLNCKNVKVIEPVGYVEFINLLANSQKVVTDSGGVQKEAYILSIPCITIRDSTEWTETVEEGWNVLVGTDTDKIARHVKGWTPEKSDPKPIFGEGSASKIIMDEIQNFLA